MKYLNLIVYIILCFSVTFLIIGIIYDSIHVKKKKVNSITFRIEVGTIVNGVYLMVRGKKYCYMSNGDYKLGDKVRCFKWQNIYYIVEEEK